MSGGARLAVVALGVLCTAVAYVLYFRLIANVGPARAIAVTFLIPPFAVAWGALFLREPVTVRALAGSAIVLAGTALATGLVRLPGIAAPRRSPGSAGARGRAESTRARTRAASSGRSRRCMRAARSR